MSQPEPQRQSPQATGAENSANIATSSRSPSDPSPSTTPSARRNNDNNDNTRPQYPLGVPSKFRPDGAVQPFPGNTIITHLSPTSPLYAALLNLHAKLAAPEIRSRFALALLPPSSWHMTIFEGVCDQVRAPEGYWPEGLSSGEDVSIEECTAYLGDKLAGFELGEEGPPYRMRVAGFSPLVVGVGMRVEGVTAGEDARTRRLRGRLAERLGIRHPGHEGYELHLSVAYLLRHLDEEEERELRAVLMGWLGEEDTPGEFELGGPEFCIFGDMCKFERLFYVGGWGGR